MLIAQCEHPDGCPQPKHYEEYIRKDGEVVLHYKRFCKPHLNRKAKTGELGSVRIKPKAKSGEGNISNGYKEFYIPTHPLAQSNGRVREHRMVLYNELGTGEHPCNWCGKMLTWQKDLFVDHLNFNKLDNRLSNLVASCDSCNVKRFNRLVRYILASDLIDEEVLRCL